MRINEKGFYKTAEGKIAFVGEIYYIDNTPERAYGYIMDKNRGDWWCSNGEEVDDHYKEDNIVEFIKPYKGLLNE